MNPIIGMIHNMKLNRWHPVIFLEAPLPGGDGPSRHKSRLHHTSGFETRELAITSAKGELADRCKAQFFGEIKFSLEKDFPWDGEGVPAMVVFFDDNGIPMF